MKKALGFLFILFFSTHFLYGQEEVKTIRGYVYDDYSGKRVSGVNVSPFLFDRSVSTNEKGHFEVTLPLAFNDTLVFIHPDYYPFIKRVKGNRNASVHAIPLHHRARQIDTICYTAFQENKIFKGEIIDGYSDEALANVTVRLENKQIIAYTNPSGDFAVAIPRSTELLTVSHPDFQTSVIRVKQKSKSSWSATVKMNRIYFREEDTLWKANKNMIAIAINELATGSVGIRYQRFIAFSHAIGLHTSIYLFGRGNDIYAKDSKFKGIKMGPYYRYYGSRRMKHSGFGEIKLSGGYFDFEDLYYAYSQDVRIGETASVQFRSFGFGIGGGWSVIMPHTKNGIFSIYAGLQIFPMDVPKTIESSNYGTLEVKNNWWYLLGPGSILEIKMLIGGIF